MEANSEGEINTNMEETPIDVSKRPKRQMKTPYQLEVLEKTYSMDMYPSEATRMELSERLNLTDRQLQMWFCHRRLKDKKEGSGAAAASKSPAVVKRGLAEPSRDERMVADSGSGHSSGSGSASASGSSQFDNGDDDTPMVPVRYQESPRTIMQRRVIACIEAQLGEPLREDGPILGVEFDDLPPGAFDTPIEPSVEKDRYGRSYAHNVYEEYDGKHIKVASSSASPYIYDSPINGSAAKSIPTMHGNGRMLRDYGAEGQVSRSDMLPQTSRPIQYSASPVNIAHDEENLFLERKRKSGEAFIGREVQSHEKKMRKELEKQELLRKKMEEQMRKEMERQDRERRKEEQRMIREQQRLEEKYQREERRELERREKFMQKERLRLERMKQKEESRKEREALRQKAAMERATARKIAKESMELIEDERLELMELAASSKGLSSIVSLDHGTLQDLELFRDALCEFPPKSVQLRKPFSIQPWIGLDENVGDLLMVWKFCVTFADILGLWPFTLDEFIQAFHDFDSRLLGEIHIALLKLVVKDIEDVVRTPSGGPGTNQYTAVNTEGGHPHIVEGAFLWGIDIRNWQKHLNPLTWPEVLRQFALSAGFGPHLKKKGGERACGDDNNESKGCEDIISTLRNGSAAENAVAIMQEKGLTLQRKSRHRLTPGTVKFAAYHVLALEGSKGLNVIDIAEKIQKSGLRDLTTSKTPEASISVALSRDPILFERTAPSTYCVRPAFRKDPADAESIIAAAKDKIQSYTNSLLADQNGDEEERDDDSDGDVAEGTEIDALATPSDAKTIIDCNESGSVPGTAKDKTLDSDSLENGVNIVEDIAEVNVEQGFDIDGNKSGEPWVQGLTEGEYSDLSVEERLKALVALVGVANEGNTLRVILEDRLDAANALKKQMWAEAQLDKRRMREEIVTKFNDSSFNVVSEGGVSPMVVTENKNDQLEVKHESSMAEDVPTSIDNPSKDAALGQFISSTQQNGCTTERSRLQLKSYIGHKAEEMYVYRSLPLGQDRRRNRYWHFVASASTLDSGCGRIFVESPDGYWKLIDSEEAFDALLTSLDTRGIRESHLHIMLQKIEFCFKAGVQRNRLLSNQNRNEGGACDVDLELDCINVESPSSVVCSANSDSLEPSRSFRIELGQNGKAQRNLLKRYEDLQVWTWKECFNPSVLCCMAFGEKRCLPLLGICDSCLDTYESKEEICSSCSGCGEKFSEQFKPVDNVIDKTSRTPPVKVRLMKTLLNLLEVSVPPEALHFSWTEECRSAWGKKLQSCSSSEELLEMLTIFEGAIRREYLSADYETTEELMCHYSSSKHELAHQVSVCQLPWIPKTTGAVALRLLEFDGSIAYTPDMKIEFHDEKKAEALPKFNSRYGCAKDVQKPEILEFDRYGSIKVEKWTSTPGSKQVLRGRSGGRPRGKSKKGATGSASNSGKRSAKQGDTLAEILKQQQGARTQGQKHGRGPRTVRKRKAENKIISNITQQDYLDDKSTSKKVSEEKSRSSKQEFVNFNTKNHAVDDDDSSPSVEADDSDDDNGNENHYGFENWGSSSYAHINDRGNEVREMSEEAIDEIEENDYDDDEEDGFEPLRGGDMQIDDESDNGNADGDENGDESSDSMVSGDYSD